jgi:hypothetical protein
MMLLECASLLALCSDKFGKNGSKLPRFKPFGALRGCARAESFATSRLS